MKWLKKNLLSIILIYINILFIALVVVDAYKLVNIDLQFIFFTILGAIAASSFLHFILSRVKDKKAVILILFIFIIVVTVLFRHYIGEFIYKQIIQKIDTINSLLIEKEPIDFSYFKSIFWIFIPIIAFIAQWLVARGRFEGLLLVTLGILTFLWSLGYRETIEKSIVPYIVLIALTLGVNNHNRFMKKVEGLRIRHGVRPIRILIPLILVTITAAYITTNITYTPQGQYYYQFLEKFKDIFITSNNSGGGIGDGGKFSLKSSGYNDSSTTLGGSITINHKEVLEVRSDKTFYLKGSSKDIYNGSSWTSTLQSAMKRNDFYVSNDFSYLDIIFRDPKSNGRVVITPLMDYKNIFLPINTVFIEADRDVYVNNRSKTAYFYDFNSDEYSIMYNEYDFPDNNSSEKPPGAQDNIRSYYNHELQVYEGVTDRTKALVMDIIKGASDDMSIVNAIEEYISKNYTYSLNVSPVPKGQDFVDYYLFDAPQGYCVYSASAVTIMLRLAGIPARYVEGFKMSQGSYEDGVYKVKNSDAHAWTEAYIFDGVNYRWITVDASTTPAELEERQVDDEGGDTNVTSPGTSEGNQGSNPNQGPVVNPGVDNPVEEEGASSEKEAAKGINKVVLYALMGAIAAILLGRIAYKLIIMYYAINSANIKALYRYFIMRFRRYNHKKLKTMTDREFVEGLERKEIINAMSKLLDFVYAEHYGGLSINVDKKELYAEIENSIKKVYGRDLKYYLYKYLL